MSWFAVYSGDDSPTQLHNIGVSHRIDSAQVDRVVGFENRPLDLFVDLREHSLWWTFIGEFRGTPQRAGYFIAECQTDSEELFFELQQGLASLQATDEWVIPESGDLRWNAGFQLWRIIPDLPGLTAQERDRMFEHLRGGGEPLEFQMSSYRTALQAVTALSEEAIPCRVAVDGEQRADRPDNVDILFRPIGDTDFEPVSEAAMEILGATTTEEHPTSVTDGGGTSKTDAALSLSDAVDDTDIQTVTGVLLVVLLGGAVFSLFNGALIHPITGLATIGGFVGAIWTFPGIAAVILGREGEHDSIVELSQHTLSKHLSLAMVALTIGTGLSFAYPTLFRVGGTPFGSSWVFGSVATVVGGMLSVLSFILLVLVVAVGILSVIGDAALDRNRATLLVEGVAIYGFALFVTTGLAITLWYPLLPAL